MTTLSPPSFASTYGTDLALTEQAFALLSSGEVIALAVSGRMGAGKDSAAPLISEGLGYNDAFHEFFAKPLKDEVDRVIELVANAKSRGDAASSIVQQQSVLDSQAKIVVTRLWDEVKSGEVQSSRTRTENTRFALQYWGTDIRRYQDKDYWVKIAIRSTLESLAGGQSVFVTDPRFENEIDALSALDNAGAYTVRLKVSPEVQSARIFARDGIYPTAEALNHISETALDDYEAQGKFTVLIDTDELDEDQVVEASLEGIRLARERS